MGISILAGALKGALIELKCPHCGKVQLRARVGSVHDYRCKQCHKLFSREDGERAHRERLR